MAFKSYHFENTMMLHTIHFNLVVLLFAYILVARKHLKGFSSLKI